MAVAGTCHGGPDDGQRLEYWATRKEVFDPPLKKTGDRVERGLAIANGHLVGVYDWSFENGWNWTPQKSEK